MYMTLYRYHKTATDGQRDKLRLSLAGLRVRGTKGLVGARGSPAGTPSVPAIKIGIIISVAQKKAHPRPRARAAATLRVNKRQHNVNLMTILSLYDDIMTLYRYEVDVHPWGI